MRRIQGWTREQIIAYNLRYDGTAVSIFADTQYDWTLADYGIMQVPFSR